MVQFKVTPPQPTAAKIIKNIRFGTAVGITKTATEAQNAVLSSLASTFTLRGQWFKPQNKFGIKRKIATPANLSAEISTIADWLALHEDGGQKIPLGKHLAIPTRNVRPSPSSKIPKNLMPKALIASGKAFIETFANGTKALSIHDYRSRGRLSGVLVMYILVPRASIKKESTFFDPIGKVVKSRLHKNVVEQIAKALSDIK